MDPLGGEALKAWGEGGFMKMLSHWGVELVVRVTINLLSTRTTKPAYTWSVLFRGPAAPSGTG